MSDADYAYLNTNAWHSDNKKARAYQDASDDRKKHYEKCAEIRIVSGIGLRACGFSFGGVGAEGGDGQMQVPRPQHVFRVSRMRRRLRPRYTSGHEPAA